MRPEVRPFLLEPPPLLEDRGCRLVAKERCEVLQALAEPGVAALNSEGLPPLSSEFRGCCCLQIMDSIVRHVRRSVRGRDPPRSLVRGELLL